MDFLPPCHAFFGAAATTRWMQVTRQSPVWHKSPQSRVSCDCGSRSSEVCQKVLTAGSKKSDVRFDLRQQSRRISKKRRAPSGLFFGDTIAIARIGRNSDDEARVCLFVHLGASRAGRSAYGCPANR